jgi:hypothetical protein
MPPSKKGISMPAIGEILNMKFNKASKTQTLSGSNTTVATPLFRVTGTVKITELYAVVRTAIGVNNTAAHWRINDQTAQVAISLATGTALSGLPAGTTLTRHSLVSVALKADSAAAAKVIDPVAATAPAVHMPFEVVQKTGGVQTDIEFVYTTTDTPTTGVIQHFVEWQPMSEGASLDVI